MQHLRGGHQSTRGAAQILFKFSVDKKNIYGGDEYSHKASGHEVRPQLK
jgi:hypothetical protein